MCFSIKTFSFLAVRNHTRVFNMSTNDQGTPKKFYKYSGSFSNACRLCLSVGDANFSKNLFNRANAMLLAKVEELYGDSLPCDDSLPRLICRPCERRVDNFKKFKTLISENQNSFSRVKRCIPVSPSAILPSTKSAKSARSTSCREKLFADKITYQVSSILY